MRTAALVALVLLAAGARPAWSKEDPGGPLGMSHAMAVGLHVGSLANEVNDDGQQNGQYTGSGSANFLRLRGGGYLDVTHSGHLIAAEGTMAFGWISTDAFTPPDTTQGNGEGPVWGRLFIDFDVSVLIDVARMPPNRWLPPARLSWLGGFGMSTDFYTFFMGGRLCGALGGLQGELEYQRRWGDSFSTPNLREERVHAYLYYKSFGLGFEIWHGYSEDARGLAATDRVFRGGYTMNTINLLWVPR